jgi:serine/threonine protein kinase
VGSFELARLLGRGAHGVVYRGVHSSLGRVCAIKVLQTGGDVPGCFADARAASALRHPAIVEIYDTATADDGRSYVVMEHLEGAPLSRVLQRAPLPLATVAVLLGEVLDALSAAHARGLVHGNLHAGNIIVRPDGHAKVVDFGMARLDDKDGGAAPPDALGDLRAIGELLHMCVAGSMPGVLDPVIERAIAGGYDDASDLNGALVDATAGMEVEPVILDWLDRLDGLDVVEATEEPAPRRRWRVLVIAIAAVLVLAAIALGVRYLLATPEPPASSPESSGPP